MSQLMPPGWTWHTDPQGRVYYHHAPSGTTQWNPPPPIPTLGAHGLPQGQPPMQQGVNHGGGAPVQAGPASVGLQSAVSARYTHPRRMEYKVKEMFGLTGDNFNIVEAQSGMVHFNMKAKLFSIKEKKTLVDTSNGAPIYSLAEELLSLRGTMRIQDAVTKQTVVTMRKKGFIPMMGTSTVLAWRGASDEGPPWLEVKGNILRKAFSFTEVATGRTIATVSRKLSVMSILLEKDSYVISIEPGVDCALMVVFVVALDEQYRDDKGGGVTGMFF